MNIQESMSVSNSWSNHKMTVFSNDFEMFDLSVNSQW